MSNKGVKRPVCQTDIPVNVVKLETLVEQVKQNQSFRQSNNNNPSYDNQRRESQGWWDNWQGQIKDGKIIKVIDKIEMASVDRNGYNHNDYNMNNYNRNNGNRQGGDMKCFCCRKERHQRNECPL